MTSSGEQLADYGTSNQRVIAQMFLCKRCHSEQIFNLSGKLLHWDFRIGAYELDFSHISGLFKIKHYPPGEMFKGTIVLELDFLPYLTPQNTTVERIKTLILFS